MTWIFGSFLVTPCALASSPIVISKEGDDSVSGQSGPTGVLTRRRPHDDHAVRFRHSRESRVKPGTCSRS